MDIGQHCSPDPMFFQQANAKGKWKIGKIGTALNHVHGDNIGKNGRYQTMG